MASILAASPLFGQTPSSDTLSVDDRDVVRTMLELPVLSGLSADTNALLDSTSAMCVGDADRRCTRAEILNADRWPKSMSTDCDRAGFPTLRDAFVERNATAWGLCSVQTRFPVVSGVEIRALGVEALRKRAPNEQFIGVGAPAYGPDGRFVVIPAQASRARPGGFVSVQVFERVEGTWTPVACGSHGR